MSRRILFLAGLLFELVAIFGLFLPYELLRATGTPAALRTVPIDPRSILRGDYVILGYEAGDGYLPTDGDSLYGKTVYVVLEEKKDGIYARVRFSDEKPVLVKGQICLQGRSEYQRLVFSDIAQYFVPEGLGYELEQARNARRLLVDIVVNDDCKAIIQGLRMGSEVPEHDLPDWMQQNNRLREQIPEQPVSEPPPDDERSREIP